MWASFAGLRVGQLIKPEAVTGAGGVSHAARIRLRALSKRIRIRILHEMYVRHQFWIGCHTFRVLPRIRITIRSVPIASPSFIIFGSTANCRSTPPERNLNQGGIV